MHWTDRVEKMGRLVLWLTLASAVVLVPVIYTRMRSEESERAERARQEAERREKEGSKEGRLLLSSMGPFMQVLSESMGKGRVWFSNVSSRSGVVCIAGTATNTTTKVSTQSLATCQQVAAYASNVEIEVMFAGSELGPMCKGGTCDFTPKDVPDVDAPPAVATVASQ